MGAAVLAAALTLAPASDTPIRLFGSSDGPAPSAYTGRYYNPADEPYRLCVAQREGRHNYSGTGSNGLYQGTYQMTRELVRGAIWMASREWAHLYGKAAARSIREQLHAAKPATYSRAVWDQLFWTVLNWNGPRSGARHWAGGRFTCTPGSAFDGGNR